MTILLGRKQAKAKAGTKAGPPPMAEDDNAKRRR
jgi:hypothetical protein